MINYDTNGCADVTWEFEGAKEKGLKVLYNDRLGQFEIYNAAGDELRSWHDELNEAGDASNGVAVEEIKKFIREF